MRARGVLVVAGIATLVAAAPAHAATFSVSGTADGAGSCTGTTCTTLRAAVNQAAAVAGADAIKLGATTYNLSGQISVASDVTIAGGNASTTTIAEDGKSGRVFDVATGGKLTLAHVTVTSGVAEAAGDIGGDIRVGSTTTLVLDHARVTAGTSLRGGGIGILGGGTAQISHSLIDGNQAQSVTGATSGDAGAIFAAGNAKAASGIALSITDSTISGNNAFEDAGIEAGGDPRNVTTLTRSTLASNSASTTSGGPGIFVSDAESFTVTSSIVSGNTGDGVADNCGSTLTSGGGNVDSGSNCGLSAATDLQNTDPQLQPLTATGGDTPVRPVTALSPAVDHIAIGTASCTGTDQRDVTRPQGTGCDSGAYELDQPPETTITAGPSGAIKTNSASFSFSSTEPGVTFQCKLDGPGATTGTFAACTSAKAYSALADGNYTFSVEAVDRTGNTDATPATRSFSVDTTPPDTTITSGPSGPTNSASPSFGFTATERGSTFQCKLDGPGTTTGTFAACTTPKAYTGLAPGTYTFSVEATDAVGNTDATPATHTFTIDTTPPATTITSGPSGPTNSASPSFGFSSNEAGSTFQCRLDTASAQGTFAACTSPQAYSGLADGSYTFVVRAIDPAGNVDASPASRSLRVDTVAPDTTITSGPSGLTKSAAPSFGFSSPDATATFQCRLDGPGATTGTFGACTSPHAYSSLADGVYTFRVRAVDPAKNVDPTAATRSFTVDTTAPPTAIDSGPSGLTSDDTPSFGFSSTDGTATFRCRLDGPGATIGTPAACTSPTALGPLSDGAYTFSVTATDPAGNTGAAATRSFTVDTTPPAAPAITSPADNALQDSSTVTLGGTAEPGATVEILEGATSRGTATASGGGAWTRSFTAPDGSHTYTARATDAAGNGSAASNARTVRIDTSPPPATLDGPSGSTTDASPHFTFASTDPGATFQCRLDGPGTAIGTFGACTSPGGESFSGLAAGDYVFRLRARDAAGNVTDTSHSFTVTPSAPPPPTPQPRRTVVIDPLSGTVLVKVPGSKRFVPVDELEGIPLGSTVDVRHGRIRLFAIRRAGQPEESSVFYGGIFRVTQTSAVTQLALVERLAACRPAKKASVARTRPRSRQLWGKGKGSFRTRGQFSSATVRGTQWLVRDSCGQTLTRVVRGLVAVNDFVRHRTIVVRAHHRYVARRR